MKGLTALRGRSVEDFTKHIFINLKNIFALLEASEKIPE